MKIAKLLTKNSDIDNYDILLLLEKISGLKYSRLLAMDEVILSESQQTAIEENISRLRNGEPVQYILGTWDFIDLTLNVDRRALIPRPETELLAELVVEKAKAFVNPKIIDLGCGTGCIGLYAKSKLPNADVTLVDISADALSLAEENAKLLNLDVNTLNMDMADISESYDIIVSNPPYIVRDVVETLDKSVKDYEPVSALDGGNDGLKFYRLLAGMSDKLNEKGILLIEIGYDQGASVSQLLQDNYTDIKVIKDLAMQDRIVTAVKNKHRWLKCLRIN